MNKIFLTQQNSTIINNRVDVSLYRISIRGNESYIILNSNFEIAKKEIMKVIYDYTIIESMLKVPEYKV